MRHGLKYKKFKFICKILYLCIIFVIYQNPSINFAELLVERFGVVF
jgi:hypothetical protein